MKTSKEFKWPFEISGMGGDYERACRRMTKAGVLWLREHPGEPAKWEAAVAEYKTQNPEARYIPGYVYPSSYNDFESAILAVCDDCTGAMMGASAAHARSIFKLGWDVYVQTVLFHRKKEKGKVRK